MRKWLSSTATLVSLALLPASFATPAQAQPVRKIFVKNDCPRPVQMFIYHADQPRQWHSHGWYKFRPYESSRLMSNGVTLTQLTDHNLYFYAETTGGGTVDYWQGGGPTVTMGGATYRTMKANTFIDNDGDMGLRLTCN